MADTFDVDMRKLISKLSDLEKKQLPFALSLALNKTAQDIVDAEVKHMKTIFSNPSPPGVSYIDSRSIMCCVFLGVATENCG
jgi:hypothetical protein